MRGESPGGAPLIRRFAPPSPARGEGKGSGIYVHWPFCLAKCPYCDFNSHVRHGDVDGMAFARALARELAWFASHAPGREVASIFFGGGTPSLMPPEAVGAVLDQVGRLWAVEPRAEITLEANPTSAEARNFAGYRAAGVNRVSIGIQALNDPDLKVLGRLHTAEEAVATFRMAARIFPRASFDLIYARPHQTVAAWREELERALALQQGHMSLYQLTIEPGTPFASLHGKGALHPPDEDLALDLYDLTQELTRAAGLPGYEISNHAAPGDECRHNLLYWRYGEYAGVGPGAHSRLLTEEGRLALSTARDPETWRRQVEEGGSGVTERTVLSPQDQGEEYLIMGLRLTEGIDLARYRALAGCSLDRRRMAGLEEQGLIALSAGGTRLAATPSGRRILNTLIAALA